MQDIWLVYFLLTTTIYFSKKIFKRIYYWVYCLFTELGFLSSVYYVLNVIYMYWKCKKTKQQTHIPQKKVTNSRSVFLSHIEIQPIQPQDWALWFEFDLWFHTHLHSDYYILFIYEDYITHIGVTDIGIPTWAFMVH